ncbi:MAG: AbrB/MazE/SpoVT family DNA-binding domain-containing protein [Candidatus Norongarragalinales archaeon]
MNIFGRKAELPEVSKDLAPFFIACKLDSKARLVLPLSIREKLSASKGDTVLLEIFSGGTAAAFVRFSKGGGKGLRRTSKNGWESCP